MPPEVARHLRPRQGTLRSSALTRARGAQEGCQHVDGDARAVRASVDVEEEEMPSIEWPWQPVESRIALLHPAIRRKAELFCEKLNEFNKTQPPILLEGRVVVWRVFETYRSPARQEYLFHQRPKVTNARAWQSAHQYGLAFDVVGFIEANREWTWDDRLPWAQLTLMALSVGLAAPFDWDPGHIQSPAWKQIRDLALEPTAPGQYQG